jgi:hypothetical protein
VSPVPWGNMASMRRPTLPALVALALLATGCGEMDEADLVEPGTTVIEADPGQLRVLRHRDDPGAGDRWIEVLAPDPGIVEATERFREEGSRQAEDAEAADVRLLYRAVDPGRTVLVQLNCVRCEDGIPATDPGATQVLVWDFVVGDPTDDDLVLGDAVAHPGRVRSVAPGEHVVVVRRPGDAMRLEGLDGEVLRLVGRHAPDDGARLAVDVFTAVGAGQTTFRYGPRPYDEYVVRVG